MIEPKILKGFRDFLPEQARKRQYVINAFKAVFESFGFEPLETPSLEYEEILLGKYGEEGDKLMYRFIDNGARKVALRYDQTVPLARVVAQYQNELPIPFKRYQIQPVWRAENTQKGRFREFIQCDVDTVGIDSPLIDAELIATACRAFEKIRLKDFKVYINDRTVFEGLPKEVIIALDKIEKIGEAAVVAEMVEKGVAKDDEDALEILNEIRESKPTKRLEEVFAYLKQLRVSKNNFEYAPTLARGLDYYTSIIFEIKINNYTAGSVCGGGRYDKLLGMFAGRDIPANGFAMGFDRIIEALTELNLFPENITQSSSKVLVTIFNEELIPNSIETVSYLRDNGINAEIYLNIKSDMGKQLKYADKKNIPFAIIIGPEEVKEGKVTLKNLITKTQEVVATQDLLKKLLSVPPF